MKPIDQKIYLASKSPRRRELLRQIGVEFELLLLREHTARGPDVPELVLPGEAPLAYVERVTREKVETACDTMLSRRLPVRPVLTADTTVTLDGRILGKPANATEAIDMLRLLSGRTHQVLTSIALRRDADFWQMTHASEVTFDRLSDDTMRAYCALPEPYDKAGGYAVQGRAAQFIRHISGSHSGIMGLPLFETAQLLQQAGIRIL
ncbi:Maf family protein [Noviherbaspirillum sp. 1P10PC]|uniref:Maf family protein n=1 Tax=Noviherbaspirillum sp. 1P10PC TaxID=3132292 RepID=UPI0039A24121